MKKQIKKTNKKHESGRSMIEMVGVLAVMGLITAAAFVLITSAMRSQKVSRVDDDVSAISAGVRLLYTNSDDFSGITTATSTKVLKSIGFGSVKPAYGSDATYAVAPIVCTGAAQGTTAKKCFTISFDTGDATLCSGLKARSWANGGTASCAAGTGTALTKLVIEFTDGK